MKRETKFRRSLKDDEVEPVGPELPSEPVHRDPPGGRVRGAGQEHRAGMETDYEPGPREAPPPPKKPSRTEKEGQAETK